MTKKENLGAAIKEATTHYRQAVDQIRQSLEQLREEKETLLEGPLPRKEAIAKMEQAIDTLAASHEGTFGVDACIFNGREPIRDLRHYFEVKGHVDPLGGDSTYTDTSPLMAKLFGDAIKAHLRQEIEARDYVEGPPAKDRPALIEKLDSQIHAAEVEEERLISEAEATGIEILRRDDCDPAIVLSIENATPEEDGDSFSLDGLPSLADDSHGSFLEKG